MAELVPVEGRTQAQAGDFAVVDFEGDDLVVISDPTEPGSAERARFTFPRQRRDRHVAGGRRVSSVL